MVAQVLSSSGEMVVVVVVVVGAGQVGGTSGLLAISEAMVDRGTAKWRTEGEQKERRQKGGW